MSGAAPSGEPVNPTPETPDSLLPHRQPFLFITHITSRCEGTVLAQWRVAGDEAWLAGHFPSDPIVPGVLIGEALAQAAGLTLAGAPGEATPEGRNGYLARIELRFYAPVRPPACIELAAARTGTIGTLHQFDVTATCAGARVAHGSLVLAVRDGSAA